MRLEKIQNGNKELSNISGIFNVINELKRRIEISHTKATHHLTQQAATINFEEIETEDITISKQFEFNYDRSFRCASIMTEKQVVQRERPTNPTRSKTDLTPETPQPWDHHDTDSS